MLSMLSVLSIYVCLGSEATRPEWTSIVTRNPSVSISYPSDWLRVNPTQSFVEIEIRSPDAEDNIQCFMSIYSGRRGDASDLNSYIREQNTYYEGGTNVAILSTELLQHPSGLPFAKIVISELNALDGYREIMQYILECGDQKYVFILIHPSPPPDHPLTSVLKDILDSMKISSQNKGLVRTGDPQTARPSAQP